MSSFNSHRPVRIEKSFVKRALLFPAIGAVLAMTFTTLQPALADTDTTGLGTFDEVLAGNDAIEALGADLPIVADSLDLTPREFTSVLHEDNTQLLPNGRLVMAHSPAIAGTVKESIPAIADWDLPHTDAFELQSKPDSTKTIYLDFNGNTISSSNWWTKGFDLPRTVTGYSIDSDPYTFNDEERRAIAWIWAQVAEDYAPFDVNVTTKAPTNPKDELERKDINDSTYGAHVVITSNQDLAFRVCRGWCSGIAFMGTFNHYKGKTSAGSKDNSLGSDYQPAWVFDGPNTTGQSATYIAETASHEAGHNLGLLHSSTRGTEYYSGHANWSPIMGTSESCSSNGDDPCATISHRPISQWTKGSYPGSTRTQDQLSTIQAHGLTRRGDEVGSTVSTSLALRSGYIASEEDQDIVTIGYCPSNTLISIKTATMANLDTRVELIDTNGKVVSSTSGPSTGSSPASPMTSIAFPSHARQPANTGVSISTPTAGVYYLRISGEGSKVNNYPRYGSLGKWDVSSPCDANGLGPEPGSPTSVAVTPKDRSAALTWAMPASGRIQDISGWRISNSENSHLIELPATARAATVSGLVNGVSTNLTIRALTGLERAPSSAFTTLTTVARTTPSAPKVTGASSGKKGGKVTAHVKWNASTSHNGAAITHYRVTAYRYSGSKIVQTKTSAWLPAKTRKLEMALPKKGTYTFRVAAKNAAGSSKLSNQSKKVTGR